MLSFHFVFTGKPIPACPLLASEWYSRWPLWIVVKNCPLFFGHLRALSRPISCCFISVLLPVLARVNLLVMFLHSMLFFLTQRFIAPHVVSADPNHLLGHRHPCCWGLGDLAYTMHAGFFMAYSSTLTNAGWKEVGKLAYQA